VNKKNILLVSSEFPPQPGGIGNHAFQLSSHLQKNNFQVTVITDSRSKNGGEEITFDSRNEFQIKRVSITSPRWIMYLKRIISLFSEIKKNEIIIATGKFSLWTVAFASLFYKKKYIAVIHGTEVNFQNKYLKYLTNRSLKKFDKVIAVSNFTKSLVSELHLKNIHVIPNGIDLQVQKEIETITLKGKPSLITVGNVTERKGQANVIKMLPTLIKNFPNIHYHCVGIPTQKEDFLQLAKHLKVENHITFHGKVSDRNLHQLLKNSDIFVMLSNVTKTGDVEGFGIAILEANYFGLPAIGSVNCGIEDAIVNGETGYLIHNKNEKSFNDSIEKIMNGYSFYSEKSKEWAENHHWGKIIQEYIKIIEN